MPRGLFEQDLCRKVRWIIVKPAIRNGNRKCRAENTPQAHSTAVCPMYGKAEKRLVMTVEPQNDICPHGRT